MVEALAGVIMSIPPGGRRGSTEVTWVVVPEPVPVLVSVPVSVPVAVPVAVPVRVPVSVPVPVAVSVFVPVAVVAVEAAVVSVGEAAVEAESAAVVSGLLGSARRKRADSDSPSRRARSGDRLRPYGRGQAETTLRNKHTTLNKARDRMVG